MGHILNLNFQEIATTWLQKKDNTDANRQIFFSSSNIGNIKELTVVKQTVERKLQNSWL